MKKLNRRQFLRGAGAAGAVSLSLPLLPSLSGAQAASDFPLRLVVFFSGNGTIANNWIPNSTNGQISQLSDILSPLQPHLQKLAVVEGLDITAALPRYQPASGFHAHERGLGAILTGRPLQTGPMEAGSGYATGQSIDQFIADGMVGETSIHSLQVGLISRRHSSGWYNRDTMTYAGDNTPLFAQSDGSVLFSEIFGGDLGGAVAYEKIQKRRQSVLDFVKGDLTKLESRISAADKLRLEQHHTAFRELEQQLEEPPPSCGEFALRDLGWLDENNMTAISDFQIEQTVQALACDRTRVATIQYGKGLGALSLRAIGLTDGWHGLSHEGDTNNDAQGKLTDLNRYIAGRFAKLLDEMDRVQEGDGTMLDHSIVLWVNELGKGNNHDHNDVPIVMAGGGHGFFKTGGAHIELGESPNNDLLISLAHAFGHTSMTEFGLSELSSGPLTAVHS